MRKKKPNQKYMTTRTQYKAAKSYDHAQFDAFCTSIYAEGFKDGEKSVQGTDIIEVMGKIKTVKGIGEKRLSQIETAVSVLFDNKESEDETR
jgi:hypothetical protein